jgi:hypothetical protein
MEQPKCVVCGERFDPNRPNAGDGWAEMYDPDPEPPTTGGGECHYACGASRGWELA